LNRDVDAGTVALSIVVVVVVLGGLAGAGWLLGVFDHDDMLYGPQTDAKLSHDESAEAATLTLEAGDAFRTDLLAEVYVVVYPAGSDDGVRPVVENGGNYSREGVWVADDRPGVAAFPAELGDSIRVVADGLDSDGDGRAGIEQGDVVRLVYVTDGGEVENGLRWTIGASGNATAS
jgi:hypothetical protein